MKIFGILNITPDSFSDGNIYMSPQNAAAQAKKMLAEGAFAVDVGAESTRPGAFAITPGEEWERLSAVMKELGNISLSIDTRNPATAEKALLYNNVKYLNDVSGFNNLEMVKLAAAAKVNIIVMHSLSVPVDKNITLTSPPVETLTGWIGRKFEVLSKSGITPEKIIFDPGIGFGKTPEQSREIIARAGELAGICHKLGTKILYGHSRKSFLGGDIASRDFETAKITAYLQTKAVDFVRVHNVQANLDMISNAAKIEME